MKFDRREHIASFEWTHRKLLAAQTKPARERRRQVARYPLFAEQAPEPVPFDPHVEGRLRDQCARQTEQRMRDLYARVWRASRRFMQQATAEQQGAIREGWKAWRGPRTATYFRYVVDLHTGVMAQREEAFRAREAASRQALMRTLQAQRGLDLEASRECGNDPAADGINTTKQRR